VRHKRLVVVAVFLASTLSATDFPLRNLDESNRGLLEIPAPDLGTVVRDAEVKMVGESSLRFELESGEPVVWEVSKAIPCEPGVLYQLEARIRCLLLGSAGIKLFAEWLDEKGMAIQVGTLFWG